MNYNASFKSMKNTPHRWCYLRDPSYENYQIFEDKIRLLGTEVLLDQPSSPTFIGIRQSEFHTKLSVNVICSNGEAGITYYMDENHHYDLAITSEKGASKQVILRLCVGELRSIINQVTLPNHCNHATLKIVSDPLYYSFSCVINGEETSFGKAQTKYLSSEVAGGFTGVIMAMYAEQKEIKPGAWAEFTDFNWEQQYE